MVKDNEEILRNANLNVEGLERNYFNKGNEKSWHIERKYKRPKHS